MSRFLEAFVGAGTVSEAAQAAGIGRRTAYDGRAADPVFAARWDEIDEAAIDRVERAAFRHAEEGDPKLITFLLSTRRSSPYRETKHVEHSGTVSLVELAATSEDA